MKFFSRSKKSSSKEENNQPTLEQQLLLTTPTKFRKSPSEILNDVISKASTEWDQHDSSPPSILKISNSEPDDVSEIHGSVTGNNNNSTTTTTGRRLFSPTSEISEKGGSSEAPLQLQKQASEKALDKFLVIPETDEKSMMVHSTKMNKRIQEALLENPPPNSSDSGRPPRSPAMDRYRKSASKSYKDDDASPRGVLDHIPAAAPPSSSPSRRRKKKRGSGSQSSKRSASTTDTSFDHNNRTSSILSVSMFSAYSGNTDATTLPATNISRECNPLNPIVYLSLIMPLTHKLDRIESGREDAEASKQEHYSTPREVIIRSLERNLDYMILNGDRTATSGSATTSLPVSVDDNTLELSYYENSLGVVDSVAQAHVLKREFGAAFEVYLSLYTDLSKNRKEVDAKAARGRDRRAALADLSIRRSLLNRLTVTGFLAGSKHRCIVFAKEALRLANKHTPKASLICFLQMGLVQLGLEEYENVLVSWREAIYKAGYNIENAALIWNNLATLRYYGDDDLDGAQCALLESLALQKQVKSRDAKVSRRSLSNMAITLSNLAVIMTRREQYASALAYLEESLLLQESVFANGSKEIDTTLKLIAELEQVVMLFGEEDVQPIVSGLRMGGESNRIRGQHWSDSDGLPLLRASTMSSSLDYISLGSLEHELGPYQRIRDVLMKNFAFDNNKFSNVNRERDAISENASEHSKQRKSMPVDLDDVSLVDAEHCLEQIYQQATHHLEQNDVEEVVELLKGSLRDHRQKYGTMHPLVGSTLHNLGMTLLYAGKYNQSLAYFQHAVDVRSTTLGPEHPETNASLVKIGMLQASNSDFQNSLATFSQVLRGRRRAQGYNHVEAAKALNNIACVDYECGGLISAQKSLEEAIDILEKNAFRSTDQDEETIDRGLASVLSNMGFLLYKRDRLEEAKRSYERVVTIQEKWDPDSVEATMENIAFLEDEMDPSRSFVNTTTTTTTTNDTTLTSLSDTSILKEAFDFSSAKISLMKLAGCA